MARIVVILIITTFRNFIFICVSFIQDTVKTYLESCLTQQGYFNYSCSSTQNLICAWNGLYAGLCSCTTKYYFDTSSNKCVSQKLTGLSCALSSDCRNDLGLLCSSSSTCSCSTGYFWSPATSSCGRYF